MIISSSFCFVCRDPCCNSTYTKPCIILANGHISLCVCITTWSRNVSTRIYYIRYLYHELMEKRSIKPFPVLRAMVLKQDVNETDDAIRALSEVCISTQSTTLELGRKLELLQQAVVNGISDDANQWGGRQRWCRRADEPGGYWTWRPRRCCGPPAHAV